MDFTSAAFFLFVLLLAGVYFVIPGKYQWIVLLAGSYAFYYLTAGPLLIFLVITTITTYATGVLLGRVNAQNGGIADGHLAEEFKEQKKRAAAALKKKKQWIMAAALLINFGILAFMKYFNFFAVNTNSLLPFLSIQSTIPTLSLILPLGISFYTFQSTGYVIDVYRGKIQPDRNLAKFALFVSFFPQIVQGPISRYSQLAHQLYEGHKADYARIKFGAQLVLWGCSRNWLSRIGPG